MRWHLFFVSICFIFTDQESESGLAPGHVLEGALVLPGHEVEHMLDCQVTKGQLYKESCVSVLSNSYLTLVKERGGGRGGRNL